MATLRFICTSLFIMVSSLTLAHDGHEVAVDKNSDAYPWSKYSLSLGAFVSHTDTSLRVGSGVGLDIDLEDLTGVESTNTVFRVDGSWRFTDNLKHRMDLSWFAFHRNASRVVAQELSFEDKDGNQIVVPLGTKVDTDFDIDIFQLGYSYSFLQDERTDLAVGAGLYIMPISTGFKAAGFIEDETDQGFTAPLPVFNFRADFAIAEKWKIRSQAQFLYLEIEQFEGSIVELKAAVEYEAFEHVGFGVGFDSFTFSLAGDGSEDYPGIDLRGDLDFTYTGLQIYSRIFF